MGFGVRLGLLLLCLLAGFDVQAGTRRYCADFETKIENGRAKRHCVRFALRQESGKEAAAGAKFIARPPEKQIFGKSVVPVTAGMASSTPAEKPRPDATIWRSGTVTKVIDGDTLELAGGERVRLLDINTTELAHHGMPEEPMAAEAKTRTTQLALGRAVQLRLGSKTYDDYGRLLAHVLLPQQVDGKAMWLNGTLVREGLAVVYTFADNRVYPQELLALERAARQEKRGLWRLARWQPRDALTCCKIDDMTKFMLVDGTVRQVVRAGERWYLNFGPDWPTDFTVEIAKGDTSRYFKNIDLRAAYMGKTLEARGMLKPVDGAMMRVTHPEQLVILTGESR